MQSLMNASTVKRYVQNTDIKTISLIFLKGNTQSKKKSKKYKAKYQNIGRQLGIKYPSDQLKNQ